MLLNSSYVWEALRDNELYLRRFDILQIKQHFKTCRRKVETDEEMYLLQARVESSVDMCSYQRHPR